MISGHSINWISLPFPHQRDRRLATLNGEQWALDLEDVFTSYDIMFKELDLVRKNSFESDYRRRNPNSELKFEANDFVRAYANPNGSDFMYLTRGLLMGLEDACQTIVSDVQSLFALNSGDSIYQRSNISPNVLWIPTAAHLLDPQRHFDYSLMIEVAKMHNDSLSVFGIFYKFISRSPFRQALGDLLTAFASFWTMAHEDAHFVLGHSRFFNNHLLGALPGQFFQEFFSQKQDRSKLLFSDTRRSAELSADSNACASLIDHIFCNELYQINSFLYEHLDYTLDGSTETHFTSKAKSIYLFRLSAVAVIIALTVFERTTRKNGAFAGDYPSLGMRVLNALYELSGRVNVVTHVHSWRGLVSLERNDWLVAFTLVQKDVEIILKYLFEQGFVLQDQAIGVQTVRELNDVTLDKELFQEMAILCFTIGSIPEVASDLTWKRKEIIENFLNLKTKALEDQISTFADARFEVNIGREDKVKESINLERELIERFNRVLLK